MKIVLVGEAWGRHEEKFQHPLVGPSGREMASELGATNLAPYLSLRCWNCRQITRFITPRCEFCGESIWPNELDLITHWKKLREEYGIAVTNVFNRRPPLLFRFSEPEGWVACEALEPEAPFWNIRRLDTQTTHLIWSKDCIQNDLGGFFGRTSETPTASWKASKRISGTHLKLEYFHHIESLWNEIRDLNPNLVIALGNAACWALLDQTKITTLRGTVARSFRTGHKILPTFHPAAVLHQLPMRVSVLADLTKAKREAEFPEIRRPQRWITIIDPTPEGIADGREWLSRSARAYACDIETFRGQITMIGFARTRDDALVIQFRNYPPKDPNYWPTPDLEFDAWKLVVSGLESEIPKIFQNGVYDLSYLIRLGIRPRNCLHDTMLWAHSEYPELPKSLGYLGSIYANEVAWKTMVRHDTLKRDE